MVDALLLLFWALTFSRGLHRCAIGYQTDLTSTAMMPRTILVRYSYVKVRPSVGRILGTQLVLHYCETIPASDQNRWIMTFILMSNPARSTASVLATA